MSDALGPVPAPAGWRPVAGPVESPGLVAHREAASAYEIKFLLSADEARRVQAWAARHLPLDVHADPALGNAYRTVSLYLDTPALDVYHRVKPYRKRKFRVRCYGAAGVVFLERKTRRGDRVRKRRTAVPADDLARLDVSGDGGAWPGAWFTEQLQAGGLRPVCLVGYERVAHAAAGADGPLRLTLDRHMHCRPAGGWRLEDVRGGLPLLDDGVILELKFCGALPGLFKSLIEEMRLAVAAASKYRLAVRAWGLDGAGGGHA